MHQHRAEADLRGIWVYSFRTWDEAQADRYLDLIESGLRTCGAEPGRSRYRDDVRPGYRSLLISRHIAFYTVGDDEVIIQRVLHGSVDPDLHLEDD